MKKFELTIVLTLIISMLLGICSFKSFASNCDNIRGEVLRLHILANSDSDEDQSLKLKVRDAVLLEGADIFDGAGNLDEAENSIKCQLDAIKKIAEKTIVENGCNYCVKVELSNEYFNTRTYDNITLPAGNYNALRIIIGEGAGHNWWCVMFPPMCLPAAESKADIEDVLKNGEIKVVKSNPKYDVRFKIIEIIEEYKSKK